MLRRLIYSNAYVDGTCGSQKYVKDLRVGSLLVSWCARETVALLDFLPRLYHQLKFLIPALWRIQFTRHILQNVSNRADQPR